MHCLMLFGGLNLENSANQIFALCSVEWDFDGRLRFEIQFCFLSSLVSETKWRIKRLSLASSSCF